MVKKIINIHPLSGIPLHIEHYGNGKPLGTSATGFGVKYEGETFLITNWHVVTGRHPDTDRNLHSSLAVPDEFRVWLHVNGAVGSWKPQMLKLMDDEQPVWFEHPQGQSYDVVAIPLKLDADLILYDLDLSLSDTDIVLEPAEQVSIIGFPHGISTAGKIPIWKTGHVATDIDIDWGDKPRFLIDATTKGGMSGAPVVAKRLGGFKTSKGMALGGSATKFLGVYSGRELGLSGIEVGIVWKPSVIKEILNSIPNTREVG